MVGSKLGLRMTTLHEETSNAGNQLSSPAQDDYEEKSEADYGDYDTYQVNLNLSFIILVVQKLKHLKRIF